MKNTLIVILVFLSTISLAFAASTIVVTDTVRPDIRATFNETVILEDYYLEYLSTGEEMTLTDPVTSDNKMWLFKPTSSLQNGFYFFNVTAHDEVSNEKTFRQNIIINVNKTEVFFITPALGISSTAPPFDLHLESSRNADCKWGFQLVNFNDMQVFEESGLTLDHSVEGEDVASDVENVNNYDVPRMPKFYVSCIDELDLPVQKSLVLGYDESQPSISLIYSENPVRTYPPQTIITVTSDDVVVCYRDGIIFDNQDEGNIATYKFTPSSKIIYEPASTESNGNYNYNIVCKNAAGLATSAIAAVAVSLEERLVITIESPEDFTQALTNIIARTNKDAACTAKIDSEDDIELVPDAEEKMHTAAHPTIQPGSHIITVSCLRVDGTAEATKAFLIDITAPTVPTINASACTSDELNIAFFSNDSESGIKAFNYSVFGTNTSVNSSSTSSKVEITNLKMVRGEIYSIQATAINGANKMSPVSTSSFTFNPNLTKECQEQLPPIVRFNITSTFAGMVAKILCYDESGCVQSSIKYGIGTVNCTPAKTGTEIPLKQPETVCYEAADIFGNVARGSQLLTFKALSTSCSNGIIDGIESDIDCGGTCLGCDVGLKCSASSDCADNYCVNGICEKPLCTDKIKNGFETDIDCGGSSCSPCSENKACVLDSDCTTSYCNESICKKSSCTDKIKNGFETDIDCGGKDCSKCTGSSSCKENDDCDSGNCQFQRCVAGKEPWESWAATYGIDVNDKDGDLDEDGLTNYQEWELGTDPTVKDTDGDGYSDYDEYKAGTNPVDSSDFPKVSHLFNYILLAIGIMIAVLGIAMFTYFKIDKQSSLNVALIGGAAILFALIDWLLFAIPRPILLVVCFGVLGGAGYLTYTKHEIIVGKLTGKSSFKAQALQKLQAASASGEIKAIGTEEKPLTKEELAATKEMIDMIKKQKSEREKQKQAVFEAFGESKAESKLQKPGEITPIRPIEIKKPVVAGAKEKIPSKAERRVPAAKEVKAKSSAKPEFERLAGLSKKEKAVEELSKLGKPGASNESISELDRLRRKKDAFVRLSGISKSKTEDVFSKMPKSEKAVEELDKLDKKKRQKK